MVLSWLLQSFVIYFCFYLRVMKTNKSGETFDDLNSSNIFLKKNSKLKKKGRKCQWSETPVNNLVDIFVENDN